MGMNYGDYLLKETANCIQRAMEPGQKLFRLVSDQFIITDLTGRSVSDARLLYNRIRYEIACWIETHQYQTVFTISAGIIDTKDRVNDYDQILKFLEFALNEAKLEGKNECYLFQKEDYHAWVHRAETQKTAFTCGKQWFCGFEIYYQPIMHTREHSLVSAEALMRFFVPADPDADGDETGVGTGTGHDLSCGIYSYFGRKRPDHSGGQVAGSHSGRSMQRVAERTSGHAGTGEFILCSGGKDRCTARCA